MTFLKTENSNIQSYIKRGGNLLVTLSPEFEEVRLKSFLTTLEQFGISFINSLVLDSLSSKEGGRPSIPIVTTYDENHPITINFKGRTFNGYHRKDGKVGTANHWLVIPLTFCENRNLDVLEGALSEKLGYETKKDFAVDTEALIKQYKAGASSEEILNTPIITTKEEISKKLLK